jgi:hypothetical protein
LLVVVGAVAEAVEAIGVKEPELPPREAGPNLFGWSPAEAAAGLGVVVVAGVAGVSFGDVGVVAELADPREGAVLVVAGVVAGEGDGLDVGAGDGVAAAPPGSLAPQIMQNFCVGPVAAVPH